MATIASLVVNIGADISDIVRNSDRAATSVEGFAAKATSAIKGLAVGWVVTELLDRTIQKFNELADRAQALDHLARTLDISAESAHRFSLAAEGAGTSVDTLATAMGRVETSLVAGGQKATDVSAALKSLGISAKEFIALPADERAYAMAAAFSTMKDRTIELRAANELFGKQAHEMLGLLNQDFIDAAENAAAMSTETISAMKEMGEATEKFGNIVDMVIGTQFAKWREEASNLNTLLLGIGAMAGTGTAGMIGAGDLPEPAKAPFANMPAGMPKVNTEMAILELNEKLADQARLQEAINKELAEEQAFLQGQATDVARIADGWLHVWERVKEINAEYRVGLTLEGQRLNNAIALNRLTQIEAAKQSAAIEQKFNPEPGTDAVGAIIARADAEVKALTEANQGIDIASLGEAIAEIYHRANSEIAAMQAGLDGVGASTKSAVDTARQLTTAFQATAASINTMATSYSGYVDPQGKPTTELRSAVLANMPASTLPNFGGQGSPHPVNNITINGAIASDEDALRRLIDRLFSERASQGRLRPSAA